MIEPVSTQSSPPSGGYNALIARWLGSLHKIPAARKVALVEDVETIIHVADVAFWSFTAPAYTEAVGDPRPTRSIVPTKPLHHGLDTQIDAIFLAR